LKSKKSIEAQVAFVVGYYGVPVFYLVASSGMFAEECVGLLKTQSSIYLAWSSLNEWVCHVVYNHGPS